MREAFPGLPFNSNVAAEKLLLSTLSAPLDQTVHLKEQKVNNKLRHSTVSPLTVSLSSSSLSSNATVASNSAATSHKHGPGIVITEKIINNSQGETIEEALVDTESEKNVVLDSHSAQSNVGNLPSTVVQAGTAVATTTTTSNAGTSSTTPSFGELDELHSILHFPEEVALRITDTEYHLFYQVRFIVVILLWLGQLLKAIYHPFRYYPTISLMTQSLSYRKSKHLKPVIKITLA